MTLLEIDNLHVTVDGNAILKGLNLTVNPGEIHALMGPNGAGKSTLAKVVGGHPAYEVTEGEILLQGESVLELEPAERATRRLFMSFQYPLEVPGVTNRDFLRTALQAQYKARGEVALSDEQFSALLQAKLDQIQMDASYLDRHVNEGFSGGEKKRNEILQMALLDPRVAILDETDSGLDIDALRIVAAGVKALMTAEKGLILITHYQRLLNYIEPHYVHVMVNGAIVQSGGPELAHKLEGEGYDWITKGAI